MAAFLNLLDKSKPVKLTSLYRRAPNAAGGLYLWCQDDLPNTFTCDVYSPIYSSSKWQWGIIFYLCVRPLASQPIFIRCVVIYKAFCLDVTQDRMNGAPNETWTHSWSCVVVKFLSKEKLRKYILLIVCIYSTPPPPAECDTRSDFD